MNRKQKLLILTYHRVIPDPDAHDPDDISESQFDMQVSVFSKYFNPLTLSDAASRLRDGKLPARAVCVTFDDGYRDNAELALPILRRHQVPATFFVATSFLDGGIMWNDRVIQSVRRFAGDNIDLRDLGLGEHAVATNAQRMATYKTLIGQLKHLPQEERLARCLAVGELLGVAAPTDLMMETKDLLTLRDAGMEIGGHTQSHPILSVVDDATARAEIGEGKRDLERILDAEIAAFAYPNGRPGKDFERRHAEMVRDAGFSLAVTTAPGCVSSSGNPYQLGRFSVWHRTRPKLIARLMLNYFAGDPATA